MPFSIIEAHPRPDFARTSWTPLDGTWELALDHRDVGVGEGWHRAAGFPYRIEVPFPVESKLSGVGAKNPPKHVWYMRRFARPAEYAGKRVRLVFGAVDYKATIWLNDKLLGVHEGGYTPFSFDITDAIVDGDNKVVMRVFDSRSPFQVRGKQTQRRKSWNIFYTTVTGIWQSVWLEAHGPARLASTAVEAHPDGRVTIRYKADGHVTGSRIVIDIADADGKRVAGSPGRSLSGEGAAEFVIPDPKPWAPGSPNLYAVRYRIVDQTGAQSDEVVGYFGLRSVSIEGGKILLNGAPFYHKFLLNQGYFPDGIYRPADVSGYEHDVRDAIEMGFNGVRIHQKVEDPRFLYQCDKQGLAVWGEMPSFHLPSAKARASFLKQWLDVIDRDFNHPSIIAWVPFNESWGVQTMWLSRKTLEFFKSSVRHTRSADRTRLVIDNSGWEHYDSDILDTHTYAPTIGMLEALMKCLADPDAMKFSVRKAFFMGGSKGWPLLSKPLLGPGKSYRGEPIIVSEYGGFGFYPTQKGSLLDNFKSYTLAIAKARHVAGYAYTQQYDTEQERNGLLSYDRVPKIDKAIIKQVNDEAEKAAGY